MVQIKPQILWIIYATKFSRNMKQAKSSRIRPTIAGSKYPKSNISKTNPEKTIICAIRTRPVATLKLLKMTSLSSAEEFLRHSQKP